LKHTLLQKRDGTYWLALWLGASNYNTNTKTTLTVAPVPMTITWQGTSQGYVVYSFDGAGNVTNSGPVSGSSVQLNVGSNVTIVEITVQPS
jgi:hypothetical protein